jgi:hypothetical protein
LRKVGVAMLAISRSLPNRHSRVPVNPAPAPHHWGREIDGIGHDIQLIALVYVKPLLKRQKNDAADAEAIAEAASRAAMRVAPVKSAGKPGACMVAFKTHISCGREDKPRTRCAGIEPNTA